MILKILNQRENFSRYQLKLSRQLRERGELLGKLDPKLGGRRIHEFKNNEYSKCAGKKQKKRPCGKEAFYHRLNLMINLNSEYIAKFDTIGIKWSVPASFAGSPKV